MLSSPNSHVNRKDKAESANLAVCSPLRTVVVDRPRIIGERINPTGKKRFKQALLDGDMDYILSQAIEQVEAGAEILDVNVGAPGIDEKEMMIRTVKAIQSIIDVPLQSRCSWTLRSRTFWKPLSGSITESRSSIQ